MQDLPYYGEVHGESVYVLTKRNAAPHPAAAADEEPRQLDLLALAARPLTSRENAEEGGAMILPETAAQKLLVDARARDRRPHRRQGTRPRGTASCANFEPGSDLVAKVTVLAEGTQGHLTGVAIDRFDLRGERAAGLGARASRRSGRSRNRSSASSTRWAGRCAAARSTASSAARSSIRWARTWSRSASSSGSTTATPSLSVHDLLQELKTHPKIRKILEGGERLEWGAKTIPSGGFHSLPRKLHAPGLLLCGDGVGMVNVPRLKGVHYAIESGRLAAEAAFRALQRGETPATALVVLRRRGAREFHLEGPARGARTCARSSGAASSSAARFASAMTISKGRVELGKMQAEPDADQPSLVTTTATTSYPAPDGKLTFDKLSSVFASGNKTRDDQPNHIRIERSVPRDVAQLWAHMCPAQVYEVGAEDGGRHGHARGRAVELRPVRRDHRQGRPSHTARRRLGARVHDHLSGRAEFYRGFTADVPPIDHN